MRRPISGDTLITGAVEDGVMVAVFFGTPFFLHLGRVPVEAEQIDFLCKNDLQKKKTIWQLGF